MSDMRPSNTKYHPLLSYHYTRALVRRPGPELTRALSMNDTAGGIDPEEALAQHEAYISALSSLGVDVHILPPEPDYPDGVFIEDTAVVLPGAVAITRPGASSRRGETDSVARAFAELAPELTIIPMPEGPGTVDGGDILRLGECYYIGLSGRTNEAGGEWLAARAEERGCRARFIPVAGSLHLTTVVTPVSFDTIIGTEDILPHFSGDSVRTITVPPGESAAGNVLVVNGTVIVPAGCPDTLTMLDRAGFAAVEVDVSQYARADGALTCLSVLW
ncbi:MAG: amidinotransferase [Deltaproteobacteria bacterium]|nr:amidinotransferase [Candidatus Zymogenaceae bacterium]